MFNQPIGNDLRHPREVCSLCKLMVGSRQHLKVFFDPERLVEPVALVQRDMLISVTLDNDGRGSNGLCGMVGNPPEAVLIKGVTKCNPIRPSHDVGDRIGRLPLRHSFISELQPKLFREIGDRTLESEASQIRPLRGSQNRDKTSETGSHQGDAAISLLPHEIHGCVCLLDRQGDGDSIE